MKKTLAFVIAAVILFSCIVVPSFAEEYKLGDVNRDGKFNAHDVSLMMKACERAPLSIYQHPNAVYLTDDLICEAEKRFEQALLAAENEKYKRRIEREFLSVRFLRLSRLPIDSPHRKQDIEKFFEDLKSFGIIEIRERRSLSSTKNDMLSSQYVMSKSGCVLYYIMK